MIPTVPASVWEQIAVVIVFAFLLAGLGWVLVKMFASSIAEINAHYGKIINETNQQWQRYFDARSESSNLVSQQMMTRMNEIAHILGGLVNDFAEHDRMERQALDSMTDKRKVLSKPKDD
jgi:predicted PurR-regulated permease PerM